MRTRTLAAPRPLSVPAPPRAVQTDFLERAKGLVELSWVRVAFATDAHRSTGADRPGRRAPWKGCRFGSLSRAGAWVAGSIPSPSQVRAGSSQSRCLSLRLPLCHFL